MRRKIILDVDTGSDDAVALMYAYLSNEFDILGVMVSFGNQPLEYTLKNTLKIRELMNANFKVYRGCSKPIVTNLMPGSCMNTDIQKFEGVINGKDVAIHQKNFYLPEPLMKEEETPAVIWLIDQLMHSDTPVTLVPLGPLTNIALALRIEPRIKGKIEEIVIMGGGINISNMTPCAEINFYNDPEAAKIVINSGIKTTLVTLDATHSAWFGYHEVERLSSTGTKAGEYAASLLANRIEAANMIGVRKVKKSALHDVLAVMFINHPEVITEIKLQKCDIDVGQGYARGALLIDKRTSAQPDNPTYIAYEASREKMCELLVNALKN